MKFVHLHTHSHYSLLDGLAKIDDLVKKAKTLGMNALALTDHGNLYGAIEFYKKATKTGIKPIIGIEAYIAPRGRSDKVPRVDDRYFHLILLCKNETGWKNLIKLVTKSHLEGFYYKPRMDKELLRQYGEGLIALSACLSGELSRAILAGNYEDAKRAALEYRDIFGHDNFYIEICSHPGIKETIKANEGLVRISRETGIPLVATQDIHYLDSEDSQYHDILLAVQTGNRLSDDDRLTMRDDDFSMRAPEEMEKLFSEFPEAIKNTVKIADACDLKIELGKIQLPRFFVGFEQDSLVFLKKLVGERISKRYRQIIPEIQSRLDYEMGVIEKMGFADYFLIVQDFVNWAKERGIVVGPGRGSAAGSLVSYILGITNIDPLKYNLLFERFLNPDRIQMPDIDIDFTDRRRDEVLAYLRQKYGENRVAQIITFGTMAARAAIRDAGRAMGLTYGFCDQAAKLIPFVIHDSEGNRIPSTLKNALAQVPELKEMYSTNSDAKKLIDAATHLEGVARHASVHACGVVIANDDLANQVPLQRSPQDENITITQFEMHAIEDLGLLKIDLLGLANLTTIEDALRLVYEKTGERLNIDEIPIDDKKTFELLQRTDNTGVFQFESSGMRRYMKEIKPTELEDLIALVSLYRPGPMDLIPSYIRRKHGQEKITYLHPKLEPILKTTYGIGVYQEQMMQIARDLAGYTLAEADTLRKAIGKKIKSLLDEQKEKLISGMIKNGIAPEIAQVIWELFPPFARYGFNRSHAACYASIGYQTAYLKAHYPVEFMSSLLNADSGDVDRMAFLVVEAKKSGVAVLPPDINKSYVNFQPEDKNVRFGLSAIKNVGSNVVASIIEERQRSGPFKNFEDMLTRVQHKDLNKKSLESLIKCGALDSLGIERNQILANIDDVLEFISRIKKTRQNSQSDLFGGAPAGVLRLKTAAAISRQEQLAWERELLGLYVSEHPLTQFETKLKQANISSINQLINGDKTEIRTRIAGIISQVKKTMTKLGQPMLFATVEDFNDAMEVLVFSDAIEKNPAIWQANTPVLISGRLSWRNNEPKFICDTVQPL
ncbi:DNA polymerase III subunit alpha [Candidatus Wolfebacteria bacterium RIFCSPLOWO2_01_FULL_45_19]|uniref:DNA-directed DNA polymerase n=1 Tax=Candidatus Wolfebacteria bacterium RIFCSPLOWO2_01_FULL_45_19 TaxID=1802557 RepID=A0A1F8DSX6_9BACT|nr:MAG: polymerase III catalytic subunit, DnaE type protein [Parcubacteria group bacterium GW2011_GWB1_45_9]OGM91694.1 MAG: DNA polymerase III subunit alpha [Candidatus Wolfebacteria bacterium RIFCSPLOWO2_01_FULL_45_19]